MFRIMISALIRHLREHMMGLIAAVLVGVVCVLPQIWFITSLGSVYRGIHFFATPNEEAYLAIMQEIIDGHPLVASVPFFEYKNSLPLLPPTIPFLYVAMSVLFHISLVNTLIISKFFLPALLTFLVYLLTYRLLDRLHDRLARFVALTTGILVVLGFDLVDYRSIWGILTGQFSIGGFLIWTRPVNPISGIILLYVFLLNMWLVITQKKFSGVIFAALALALMMASYFFSWSLALTFSGVLGTRALYRRDWKLVGSLTMIVGMALLLSSPYWIMVYRATRLPWYPEASTRIGFFLTHALHLNKFLLAVVLFFVIISVFWYRRKPKDEPFPEWWWFCIALLISSFIVYNQQIVTGREIWYYHYVFFTIPLGYTIIALITWHATRSRPMLMWGGTLLVFFLASAMGIYTQISGYRTGFQFFSSAQKYADIFDFFNKNALKDCVVLTNEKEILWSELIPAFSHCNVYISAERFVIASPYRFYHNYLVLLRMRGIQAEEIEEYVRKHRAEALSFLNYRLQVTLGFPDPDFEQALKRLPADYVAFLKKDFLSELKKYRLDYVLSVDPLSAQVERSLPGIRDVFQSGRVHVYTFVGSP